MHKASRAQNNISPYKSSYTNYSEADMMGQEREIWTKWIWSQEFTYFHLVYLLILFVFVLDVSYHLLYIVLLCILIFTLK